MPSKEEFVKRRPAFTLHDPSTGRFQRRHGHGRGFKNDAASPTYQCWNSMKDRCLNSNNACYSDYGGRGIKVCDRWLVFENFLADMGERPTGLSLDRKDNNGDYTPENCRWATRQEQQQNMRSNNLIYYNGEILPAAEWARRFGMSRHALYQRLKNGWSIEQALTCPLGSTVYLRNERGQFYAVAR